MTVVRPWCTVAPINAEWRGTSGDVRTPIDVGSGVQIVPMPDWAKIPNILKDLSWYQRTMIFERAKFAFQVEYDAASLGDPDPLWTGSEPRPRQDAAAEQIHFANVGLWLAKPSSLGFEFVLHAERHDNEWIRRQSFSVAPLTPHTKDTDASLSHGDFERARSVGDALKGLPRDTAIFAATRALLKALADTWWETRYLLLWVALEALFGPSNPAEITYRFSQRLAFFLSANHSEAARLFGLAKEGYGLRSKIVHGLRLQRLGKDKSSEMMHQAECFVRDTLVKILTTPAYRELFQSERRREEFLDTLAFSPLEANEGDAC